MKQPFALALVLFLSSCGMVGSFDYSGQWVGTVSDTVGGAKVGKPHQPVGSQLTGSWQSAAANSGSARHRPAAVL